MLIKRFIQSIEPWRQSKTLWVAYSGGLDSTVLLHMLAGLGTHLQAEIRAIHVHHGLSDNADQWQQHCQQTCAKLKLPFKAIRVDAHPQHGASPEAAAREARYRVFRDLLQVDEVLLTGHHQDDQAETLLLQLLRGAGVKGLAAMPSATAFSNGYLLRPLLSVTREELFGYAQQQHLQWLEDESNTHYRFDRNYIRHGLFPIIQQRWPTASKVIARTAQHCADAAELIEELAVLDSKAVQGALPGVLSITKLRSLSLARQRNVIRYWLAELQFPAPNTTHIEQILNTILACAEDASPKVAWATVAVCRYRDNLYALNSTATEVLTECTWDYRQVLTLPQQLGQLHCELKRGQGIKYEWLNQPLSIRFRQGGERCQPLGRQGSHPLKKCFQEWGIPPWQRDKVPLLYAGQQLLAVVGYCICEPFAAAADELGGVITLHQ